MTKGYFYKLPAVAFNEVWDFKIKSRTKGFKGAMKHGKMAEGGIRVGLEC